MLNTVKKRVASQAKGASTDRQCSMTIVQDIKQQRMHPGGSAQTRQGKAAREKATSNVQNASISRSRGNPEDRCKYEVGGE